MPSRAYGSRHAGRPGSGSLSPEARDYAAANVPEYWIVDLAALDVTVHRSPLAGIYEDVVAYVDGESVRPILADAPPVPVSELLG